MQSLQPGARDLQLDLEQAIKPHVDCKWHVQLYVEHRPSACLVEQLLANVKAGKLLDALRFSPQHLDVECFGPDPIRIVRLQRFKDSGIDIANSLAFENRPVPGLFAGQAFVDQPGIEPAAVGVKPDLAAALEWLLRSASAAGDPGLRSRLRGDGPSDPKCIAHIVLVFRSEVHQDGAGETRCGRGVAMFWAAEELRQRSCTWHIVTMPDRSLATTR